MVPVAVVDGEHAAVDSERTYVVELEVGVGVLHRVVADHVVEVLSIIPVWARVVERGEGGKGVHRHLWRRRCKWRRRSRRQ